MNRDLPIEKAIKKHSAVFLDTSILFHYLNEDEPSTHRMLEVIFQNLGPKYITPHIFAEICNLDVRTKNSVKFLERVKKYVSLNCSEEDLSKTHILNHNQFCNFGASDIAGILNSQKNKRYLLMDDCDAAQYAKSQNIMVITMGQIRAYYNTHYAKIQ